MRPLGLPASRWSSSAGEVPSGANGTKKCPVTKSEKAGGEL